MKNACSVRVDIVLFLESFELGRIDGINQGEFDLELSFTLLGFL